MRSITITPASPAVTLGLPLQLTATGTYNNGTTANFTDMVTWSSSATSVATVSNNPGTQGQIQTVAQGITTITAAVSSIAGSTALTVKPLVLESISLTPTNPSIVLGTNEQFTATGSYSDGSTRNLNSTATWSSSAPGVATVSSGLAKSVAQGVTTITAGSGSIAASTLLTVKPPVLESISLTPSNASIALGTNEQFTATGSYSDGSTRNLNSTATWSSSAPGVATVSSGLAKSVAQGVTTITAAVSSIAGSTDLTVQPPVLVSIAVTPSTARIVLAVGPQTQQFTATGTYTDGSTKELTSTASWTSSETNIVTVSAGLATVTETATGTPSISAAVGSIHGSAILTVVWVKSVAVTPTSLKLAAGQTGQMTATGTLSDASTLDVTKAAAWTSSNTGVATVSQGLATAVSPSSTAVTITATVGYYNKPPHAESGTASVTVFPPTLTSITFTPSNGTVRTGTSLQLVATGTYSDGSTQDVTAQASWTSSNPSVATAGPNGVIGGVAPGTATITALVTGYNIVKPGVSASTTVTVSGQVVSISVSPATATTPLGETEPFNATGTYSDGTTAPLTAATWSSSDTGVATVIGGLTTSVGQGIATITASVGSTAGSATLTVAPPQLVSIGITPAHASIETGTTQQLTATGTYTDKSTQDLTGSVTWASSNGAVAPVTASGAVSGAAVGVTTITETSGTFSASTPLAVYTPGQARFAYVPGGNNQTLNIFLVNNANGTLVPAETVDYPSGYPWAVAAGPKGQYLYVGDRLNSQLYGYTIDQTNGSLSPIPGMPIYSPLPWSMAVDPSGQFLLSAAGDVVVAYQLDSNGFPNLLTYLTSSFPTFITFDPSGKHAYAVDPNDNTLSVFSLDPSAGQVTEISGSPFAVPGPEPWSATVYPLGGYLFVPNANGQDISVFALDSTTGALTGSATNYSVGQAPFAIAMDPAGKFAYVANSASGTISAFSINSTTGALTPLANSPFVVSSSVSAK